MLCTRHQYYLDKSLPTTRKIKILKKWKNAWRYHNFTWRYHNFTWRYHHFTHVYHKWQSCAVCFLKYGAWQTNFFVILGRFLPFYPPNNPKNQNSEKMKMYHFTPVYHKLQSYDACFLRYRAQWTDFFVILDHSLPFYPITTRKIKILKKWKNCLEILSFTHAYHKWQSHDVWSLRYEVWQTEFCVILDYFLHFYPPLPNNPKN